MALRFRVIQPPRLRAFVARGVRGLKGDKGDQGASWQETFEAVSKNLRSLPYAINQTAGRITSIVYTLPNASTITKTLNYTGDNLTSIVLSGSTPSGITLTKTLTYTGSDLTGVTYS